VLLVGRTLIGIARRHRTPTPSSCEVEEFGDLLGRVAVEDGGVDVDGEAAGLAALIAETARSNTPFCDTALS